VSAIEIAAQKKVELNLIAVGAAKLRHFHGFLLSALVGVRKIAGGLCLEENREVSEPGSLGHDNRVNGNIDGPRATFQLDRYIGPKAEGAERHRLEVDAVVTAGKLLVAARFEPGLYGGELTFLLRVANDRIGDGPAETIRDDG